MTETKGSKDRNAIKAHKMPKMEKSLHISQVFLAELKKEQRGKYLLFFCHNF